ncbi:MAG: TonB-dependent receptor, partial [Pseudomonadota bacterium]|nr:TonB-dependent receptor [Pseudomonadota bacterium]
MAIAVMGTVPAYAQDDQQPAPAAANGDAQVFEPAYFAQFAPRNALDMVDRIPGFSISGGNDQGQRGLGQATQNVIVNGERLSSKSESVRDQLRRVPATDVVRIEILDGNATSIPGLTGQVANVVYTSNGASGQFEWTTGFRPHNTEAQLFGGEISVIGSSGALDYTVSLSNENNRFGADGPVSITDRDGALIESQYSKLSGKFDNPKISTAFSYDFGGDVTANLNLSYGSDFFSRKEPETAIDSAGVTRTREALVEEDGPEYELGGDIQFPFGPGSLKLILLERFERDNYSSSVIDRLSDDSPPRGFRFEQTNGAGERIGRLEYDWKLWGADWQLSGEAAFNRLDRRSRLFELAPGGEFF